VVELLLPFAAPAGPLYRIARKPNAWRAPDWAYAHEDRTFGSRFDDSEGYFRVLYASSTRLGCFIETLARFRKPPAAAALMERLNEIEHAASDFTPPGTVPASWLRGRRIGRAASVAGRYAQVYSAEWVSHLRRDLEPELMASHLIPSHLGPRGEGDFDLHVLISQDRSLTQKAATLIYRMGYSGICYESRHGTDLVNWALFEPFQVQGIQNDLLVPEDPDLLQAMEILGLRLDPRV
jgi:hypothetical protein